MNVQQPIDEAYKQELLKLAQRAFDHYVGAQSSASGADQVDGWLSKYVAEFYQAVAAGTPRKVAFDRLDRQWRAFAEEQGDRIAAAPKLRRGPMAGASGIHYRHVGAERFTDKLPHLFRMTRPDPAMPE